MNRRILSLGAVFLLTLTWIHWDIIANSIISLVSWSIILLLHPSSFSRIWFPGLVEYWVAAIVWVGTTVTIAVSLLRPGRKKAQTDSFGGRSLKNWMAPERWALFLLLLALFTALVAPLVATVDPNAQGNLGTVRLLPPLSSAYLQESVEEATQGNFHEGMERMFSQAQSRLLNRIITLDTSAEQQSLSPDYHVIRRSKIIFLLGTDDAARDVFSRVVFGTRVSIGIGLLAVLGSVLIGGMCGFVAGMNHGFIDDVLMRTTDLFLSIPSLFLIIGVLAFAGQSVSTLVLALAASGWMGIARVVRGEVASLREREFVLAARLLQVGVWRIIVRHLLPNLRPVLLTSAVLQFANAVLGEAALGFLGLGIQPPTASWGNMIGEATGYLGSAWWIGFFPGLFLATVIVCAHLVGEYRSAPMSAVER